MKYKKGFTLIELMVAIAIVAVLATIGFAIFQGAQAQARDARRKGDIDAIATVLENKFNATTGTYTAAIDSDFSGGVTPVDPINTGVHVYTLLPSPLVGSYTLCAGLERNGGNYSDSGAASPATGETATHYCRKNQQE